MTTAAPGPLPPASRCRGAPPRPRTAAYSRLDLILALQEQSAALGHVPSRQEWRQRGCRPSVAVIEKHFETWAAALVQAGLSDGQPNGVPGKPLSAGASAPAVSPAHLERFRRELLASQPFTPEPAWEAQHQVYLDALLVDQARRYPTLAATYWSWGRRSA